MKRKPAIQARQGHARGIDDIGKGILKGAKKAAKKASKAMNDIPDPAFKGKVYNKKGGFTKSYKDSVLRRNAGDF